MCRQNWDGGRKTRLMDIDGSDLLEVEQRVEFHGSLLFEIGRRGINP